MPTPSQLTLYPDQQALSQAHHWLEQLADQHGWTRPLRLTLQLVMDEALNNIVRHGFGPHPPAEALIQLRVVVASAHIHLDIQDNGMPFDPTRRVPDEPATRLDDAMPGGHGLRLMRHYLHDMAYHHADGYNNLRLTIDAS